jgi:hypothetical protein
LIGSRLLYIYLPRKAKPLTDASSKTLLARRAMKHPNDFGVRMLPESMNLVQPSLPGTLPKPHSIQPSNQRSCEVPTYVKCRACMRCPQIMHH